MPRITTPSATIGNVHSGLHLLCPACGELEHLADTDAAAIAQHGHGAGYLYRHQAAECASCGSDPVALVSVQLLDPIASPFTIAAHSAAGADRWTITPAGRDALAGLAGVL